MILARLTGPHVPRFVAAGDFEQPYIVMEFVAGRSLKSLLDKTPLPPDGGRAHRRQDRLRAARPPSPARHPSRPQAEQRHPARQRRGGADRLRPVAPRPASRSDRRGVRRPGRHRALHRARAGAARARRSAQRHLRARRHSLFPRHRRAAVRRAAARRRMAAPAVARSVTRRDGGTRRCRPGCRRSSCAASRSIPAERYATAAQLAFDLQHPDQVRLTERAERRERDGPVAVAMRWLRARKPPPRAPPQPRRPAVARADHHGGDRSCARTRRRCATRSRLRCGACSRPSRRARLACVNVLKTSRIALDPAGGRAGPQSASAAAGRAQALGARAAGRERPHHLSRVRIDRPGRRRCVDYARNNHVDHIVIGARGSSPLRRYLGSVSAQVVARGAVHRHGRATARCAHAARVQLKAAGFHLSVAFPAANRLHFAENASATLPASSSPWAANSR